MMTAVNALHAQFSPGELSRAHHALEGSDHCVDCHEVGRQISGDKCLRCHEEIRSQSDLRRGFHFLNSSQPCVSCHKEHLGPDAATMVFTEQEFDHSKTGFVLGGRHSSIACGQCHAPSRLSPDFRRRISATPHKTWLGLRPECAACHEDPHRNRFGSDCRGCHSDAAWSPASSFDHSKTKFGLEGRHLQVKCLSCHPGMGNAAGGTSARFQTQEFADCTPCHRTPHKGVLAQTCRSCHSASDWAGAMGKPFDHRLTAYALAGKHAQLRCEQCHRREPQVTFRQAFFRPFGACTDCHADKHNGEFRKDYRNDCAACHTDRGYVPSTFSIEGHSHSRFELTGAHRATPCAACHTGSSAHPVSYRLKDVSCAACHRDVHHGQFSSQPGGSACDRCHTTGEWRPRSFDHSTFGFVLEAKHASLACRACHKEAKPEAVTEVRFGSVPKTCKGCHEDEHGGQFGPAADCLTCHTPAGWKLLAFNHETQSSFPLRKAHQNIACDRCHRMESTGGAMRVRYKPLAAKCESCHAQGKSE